MATGTVRSLALTGRSFASQWTLTSETHFQTTIQHTLRDSSITRSRHRSSKSNSSGAQSQQHQVPHVFHRNDRTRSSTHVKPASAEISSAATPTSSRIPSNNRSESTPRSRTTQTSSSSSSSPPSSAKSKNTAFNRRLAFLRYPQNWVRAADKSKGTQSWRSALETQFKEERRSADSLFAPSPSSSSSSDDSSPSTSTSSILHPTPPSKRSSKTWKGYRHGFQLGDFMCPQCGSHNFRPPEYNMPAMTGSSIVLSKQNNVASSRSSLSSETEEGRKQRPSRYRQHHVVLHKMPIGATDQCFECGYETGFFIPRSSSSSSSLLSLKSTSEAAASPSSSESKGIVGDIRLVNPRDYVCPHCQTVNFNDRIRCVGCGALSNKIQDRLTRKRL